MACAITVARAAPATFILRTATKKRSPNTFTIQAMSTKRRGVLLSPTPRNIELIRLYATINMMPAPQIRMYCTVRSRASSGACMAIAMGRAKKTMTTKRTAATTMKSAMAPPMTLPIRSFLFAPMYLPIKTVTPMRRAVTTKVKTFSMVLPVETPEMPASVPNWPTTRRSTAPYMAWSTRAPSTGNIKPTSFLNILPVVRSFAESIFIVTFCFLYLFYFDDVGISYLSCDISAGKNHPVAFLQAEGDFGAL